MSSINVQFCEWCKKALSGNDRFPFKADWFPSTQRRVYKPRVSQLLLTNLTREGNICSEEDSRSMIRNMRVLLPLLGALLSLCQGDVGDFSPCLRFFYRSRPPTGIAGTPICQRYQNRYHFATLYSRERRTPWFSGYVFSPPQGKRPRGEWKYEPQVKKTTGLTLVIIVTPIIVSVHLND